MIKELGEDKMEKLRHIPAIHSLQKDEVFVSLPKKYNVSEAIFTEWLQEIVQRLRSEIMAGTESVDVTNGAKLHEYIFSQLTSRAENFVHKNNLQKVINATGVVIHTNLGRSRLSERALEQITETARGYSTLEYDVKTGARGSRHSLVEEYIMRLTGAEAAMVVNNNASAVYLVLKALAAGTEVIVSRGELVEIGGSFRISEIMELSDAELIEVGTTNKTRITDYERAITEETGMILKVHKSNFAILGFTEDVEADDLVRLAQAREIPLYEDLGSGTLFDFSAEGIGTESTVQTQIAKGIDIISFSGDKLLGGPQAGIIVGKKKYIDILKGHQLARVLRVDKFTLASLEATFKAYMAGSEREEIPTVRDITATMEQIKEKIAKFTNAMKQNQELTYKVIKGSSKVGGGTMPDVDLPTYIVEVTYDKMKAGELAEKLRRNNPPIIVRVKGDVVQLDFRTITDDEVADVIKAFRTLEG